MFPRRISRQLLFWTLVCVIPSWAHALPNPDQEWHRVQVDNIVLITDGTQRDARRVGQSLLLLREYLGLVSQSSPPRPGKPLTVFVFKNRDSLAPYAPVPGDEPVRIRGFSAIARHAVYIAIDASSQDLFEQIAYHEYVHLFLAENSPQTPGWLDEGLAEFYSTFYISGDEAVLGKPIYDHMSFLRSENLLSGTAIAMMNTTDSERHQGVPRGPYAAQSWGTVHYLMADEERRESLSDYMAYVHAGEDPTGGVEIVLGRAFPSMEIDLREYMQPRDLERFRLPAKTVRADIRSRRLEYVEVLTELGNLLVATDDTHLARTEGHFRKALRLDPTWVDARIGLADLALKEGHLGGALHELELALETDAENARAHRAAGSLLADTFFAGLDLTTLHSQPKTPEMLMSAREHFEASLAQHSDDPVAWAGLGSTYAVDEDPAAGIDALARACDAMPWRSDFALFLVRLRCIAGDLDGARGEFDRRLQGDSEQARQAELLLIAEGRQNADLLRREGEWENAMTQIARTAEITRNSQRKVQLEGELEALRFEYEQTRYTEAVRLTNQRHYGEALELLDTLIPELENDDLKQQAIGLKQRVEGRMANLQNK